MPLSQIWEQKEFFLHERPKKVFSLYLTSSLSLRLKGSGEGQRTTQISYLMLRLNSAFGNVFEQDYLLAIYY